MPHNPLSPGDIDAIGWMLLHFVWQGFAVAAVLAASRRFLRDARLRYATACCGMLVMVGSATFTFHANRAETLSVDARLSGEPSKVKEAGMLDADLAFVPDRFSGPDIVIESRVQGMVAQVRHHFPEIVLCWFAGVLMLPTRLLGGCWVAHRYRRGGTRPLPEAWAARVRQLVAACDVRQRVQILESALAPVPVVVGLLRPVILVPSAALMSMPADQLEAILVHELAHVRRYDNIVNLFQRIAETVFFFHPAVWWASACIRTEREHCCDDAVIARSDRKSYAEALVTLEGFRSPILTEAASDGPLLSRVRRFMAAEPSVERDRLSGLAIPGALSALIILALKQARCERR